MTQLRILWRDNPELSEWAPCNHKCPYKREEGGSNSEEMNDRAERERERERERSGATVGSEKGERAMSQGVRVASRSQKKSKEMDSPRASRRNKTLATPRASDLQNCKRKSQCCFNPLSF